jgi:trimethylguanosine synthase
MAKHIAQRVEDQCKGEEIGSGGCNVLDAFCGVGGNLIQFSRKCGFCVGSDMDPLKAKNAVINSEIYNL